jgi:hypothetical protein
MEVNMKRTVFSIIITILTILFVGYAFSIETSIYLDGFALLLVPIFGTVYSFAIIGFKSGVRAFKVPLETSPENEELKAALHFFRTLERSYLVFGIIWVLMTIIDMMKNLEDASYIGVLFASSFTGLLFSVILIAFFIIPYKAIIIKKIE